MFQKSGNLQRNLFIVLYIFLTNYLVYCQYLKCQCINDAVYMKARPGQVIVLGHRELYIVPQSNYFND